MARLINPVPQYLDGNGDPYASGLLYVYEAGTNTEKTTYADQDLTIPNTNPVELDAAGRVPNVFYDGVARLVLRDSDMVQVWEADNVGEGGAFEQLADWQNFVTYELNDFVFRDGLLYQSLINGNQGNDPSLTAGNNANWEEVRFLGTYNAAITYGIGDVVRATNGTLWRSLVGSNTNNLPTTDSGVNWSPAVAGDKIAEVSTIETRTTTAIAQSGGGGLSALRVNTLTDSSTYTLPLASSVEANQWIDIELEDIYKAQTPTVQRSGSDTIDWSGAADTDILFDSNSSISLRLYSDGSSVWRF